MPGVVVNRRVVAGVVARTLAIGSLGGVAATALLGGGGTSSGGDTAIAAGTAPESWSADASGVYDAIAPVTDQASQDPNRMVSGKPALS